jgi:hypothetical protein
LHPTSPHYFSSISFKKILYIPFLSLSVGLNSSVKEAIDWAFDDDDDGWELILGWVELTYNFVNLIGNLSLRDYIKFFAYLNNQIF